MVRHTALSIASDSRSDGGMSQTVSFLQAVLVALELSTMTMLQLSVEGTLRNA